MHRLGYLSSISTIPYTTDLIKPGKAGSCPTPVSIRYLEIRALGVLFVICFVERNLFSSGDFSKMHRLGYLSSISTIP